MLLASCMRASSAGVLMPRQPKVMGVALVVVRVGLAWADAVGEDELGALFDADLAGGEAGLFEGFGEELVGVFVFVPGVDAGGGGGGEGCGLGFHALAHAAFFEDGADDERGSDWRGGSRRRSARTGPSGGR